MKNTFLKKDHIYRHQSSPAPILESMIFPKFSLVKNMDGVGIFWFVKHSSIALAIVQCLFDEDEGAGHVATLFVAEFMIPSLKNYISIKSQIIHIISNKNLMDIIILWKIHVLFQPTHDVRNPASSW